MFNKSQKSSELYGKINLKFEVQRRILWTKVDNVKEMLYFETNFSGMLIWNWKGLTSLSIHSWFRWQSFNSSFTFWESLPKLRLFKYSIINFYLNPDSDRTNHFPKGQDSRKVGAGREFTYQRKAVFGDGKRIRK